ncbi:MAG TPA: 3'-5' exonuclease, partial [Bacillota bacterium]|nr:3'-5' exonuclease [Bacillota bacterium]
RPTAVARQLQSKFAEILTDEYQDINAVQERIIGSLARGNNTFMVGDVKQSIYRFRLAEPFLFLRKYHAFKREEGGQSVDLAANFRSRPQVLAAVNYLFRRIMTESVGEIEYDDRAALKAGAVFPEHTLAATQSAALCILDRDARDSDEDDERPDTVTSEARFIARTIAQLVSSGDNLLYDAKQGVYRPVRYCDIVVLLRATRGWSETFVDEFGKLAVPVYADTASGYFAATEVATMLSLLRVIDNPEQDIPLAAVLRSPLLGLSGDELSEIRLPSRDARFFSALQERALLEDQLGLKLQDFLARLRTWRQVSRRGSLPELIWKVYRETGYYIFVGATPGGPQRQANLRALYDRACQYERTSFRGLFRFLRFIERLQEADGDLGSAKVLGEGEDVVRILSVHKSKGLEFPVVFVAGLGRRFNMSDQNRPVLIHKDLGLGPHAVELGSRQRYPTLPRLIIQSRLRREALAEEMRILYVAMTRARERLYLVGSIANREKRLAEWQDDVSAASVRGILSDRILAAARAPLDWIGPAVLPCTAGVPFTLHVVDGEVAEKHQATLGAQDYVIGRIEDDRTPETDRSIAAALNWRYPHLTTATLA